MGSIGEGLWQASEGKFSIDLDGTPGPGGIEQTVTTTPGQDYLIQFDLSANVGLSFGTARDTVIQAAGQSGQFSGISTGNSTNMGYQHKEWKFTANSSSTTIKFSSLSATSQGAALDNISVSPILTANDRNYLVNLAEGQIVENINFGNQRTSPKPQNQPPRFTSQPATEASVGNLFRYQPQVTDADTDPLTYELVVSPNGMAIDPNSGLVVWRPTLQNLNESNNIHLKAGTHIVLVKVKDGNGGVDLQSFTVKLSLENHAPIFTSTLPGNIQPQVNKAFYYHATAIDPDQDSLAFELVGERFSAAITTDGELTWTPTNNNLGSRHLTIKVKDAKGGESLQELDLTVIPPQANRLPSITSTPDTTARLNTPYFYKIEAADVDGDRLAYSLDAASIARGMTINDGILTWTPQPNHFSATATQLEAPVTLTVNDGQGGIATQTFNIHINNQTGNQAPQITSTPNLVTSIDRTYQYDLSGADPDRDLLIWSLDSAPSGMVIDTLSGKLRWQPTSEQIGLHQVSVRVMDSSGAFVGQTFTLTVNSSNLAPTIRSSPVTLAAQGQTYRYSVIATDPENDDVRFSFGQKPVGMTITPEGQIQWTPQANQVGTHAIEVIATDSQGAIARQSFNLVVGQTAINQPPVITSAPIAIAAVGSANGYTYQVQANDPDKLTII